ncbi:MAG: dienelactone hydrolase family protein [Nitrospirae bacterium]|nr:dienelactone hydrolase family protein [Nitrospirota bacterium]
MLSVIYPATLRWIGLIGLAVNLSGCLYYGHYAARLESPAAMSIDPDYFHRETPHAPPKVLYHRERDGYTIEKLQFRTHTAFLYLPEEGINVKSVPRRPAVIILPITQGDHYTKEMARFLAQYGIISLRFQSHGHLLTAKNSEDALTEFEALLKEDVMDVLEGIDWLGAQPSVENERIGIVGISMGAVIGSVVTGVDSRIRAGVFILGGGDLAGILFSSKEPSIVSIRKRIEEEEDLTRKDLLAETARRLRNVDPLTYAARLDPGRILMINAYFDQVIKRRYGKALWEAAGEPPMVMLPTGHYSAATFFDYAQRRMLAHFEKVFGLEKK